MALPSTAKPMLGCMYMLAATVCFSAMNNLIRLASVDLHSTQIVFLRNFFSVLIFVPWLLREGVGVLKTDRISGHFWRAILGIVSMQMWFYALSHMNLAQATALNFTTPIFVVLIAVFFLKEKANIWQWTGAVLGFIGTMVIIRPGSAPVDHLVFMVLASSAIMAVVSVLVKTLTETEKSSVIVFYMAFFMTPLSFPLAAIYWRPIPFDTGLIIFTVALFSTLAHYFLTMAFRNANMVMLMPIDFVRLLFTSVFAYYLFDQTVDWNTLVGAILIIVGVIIGAGLHDKWVMARMRYVGKMDVKE
jgi:drug/metabolite transporter (DMT)-like permease